MDADRLPKHVSKEWHHTEPLPVHDRKRQPLAVGNMGFFT
jgi:hypothetical protein